MVLHHGSTYCKWNYKPVAAGIFSNFKNNCYDVYKSTFAHPDLPKNKLGYTRKNTKVQSLLLVQGADTTP